MSTKIKKMISFIVTLCLVGNVFFANFGGASVAKADENVTEKELTPLTFADFNLSDQQIAAQTYGANYTSGEKADVQVFKDCLFQGYLTLDDSGSITQSTWILFGHSDTWQGLKFMFSADGNEMHVNTGTVGSNGCNYIFTAANAGLSTFRNTRFKLSFSLETKNLDADSTMDDLLLKVYINDRLCVANQPADSTTYGANGEYYIMDMKAENLKGYIRNQYIGAAEGYCDSVKIESCEVPYLNEVSFSDYGITDQTFAGAILEGTYDGPLAYTKLAGRVTLDGTGKCIINYGAKSQSNLNTGGLQLQIVADTGAFWIITSNLGTYLNESDANGDSIEYYTSGFPCGGKAFELSYNTIPWDYDGDGQVTDGKIEVRIDGKLLKNKYIFVKDMFQNQTVINRFTLLAGGNFGTTSTIKITSNTVDTNQLRKITLAEFGRESGTYTSQSHTAQGPSTLLNSFMEININVTGDEKTQGSQIHYAVPLEKNSGWYGIRFKVLNDKITVSSADGWFDQFDIMASLIEDMTSFYNTDFKLGLSLESVDVEVDGLRNDARMGIWINNRLVRYVYIMNKASEIGTGLSIFSYLVPGDEGIAKVTVSDVVQDEAKFQTMGVEELGITNDVYSSGSKTELKMISNSAQANLDGTIFKTNVRFSGSHSEIFYGCDTSNPWYAIKLGNALGSSTKFTIQSSFSEALVGTSETGNTCDLTQKVIYADGAGVELNNNTYELGISTRTVDCDGDDVFDDAEIGIWFEGKLYNNTYYYFPNIAKYIQPRLGVYTWAGTSEVNEGQVVLGDYTQEVPTNIEYCADEYVYFVDGDQVTVNGEDKGTSWTTRTPGEYQISYKEKNSTFKEDLLVYISNDVTADGEVNSCDLIALKKLAGGSRDNTSKAGKKAVNYVDKDSFEEREAVQRMYQALLNPNTTLQTKKMSETILGQTGSASGTEGNTTITALGTTREGTSVLSISDNEQVYTTDVSKLEGSGLDFVLDFNADRNIKVLQITDTQIIDSSQQRSEGRLQPAAAEKWKPDQMDTILFDELDALVSAQKPDLILLTGDIVYGEFDDKGTSFNRIIEKMDSYKIPWAPIFGNHDNESEIGVEEQCRRFVENSTYCLFNRRHEIGGNGNYSIGISVKGDIQRVIFMMDSNGCSNVTKVPDKSAITTSFKFYDTQLAWYQTVAVKVKECKGSNVPSLMCFHVQPQELSMALVANGHQTTTDSSYSVLTKYDLGMDATKQDFGFKNSAVLGKSSLQTYLLPYLKAAGTDGLFFGHEHVNSLSVQWEGIRWTYGLKTGQYDEHPELRGGTMITLNKTDFQVKHVLFNETKMEQ